MTVEIFIPCYIDQVFPQVGFNMIKVLEKLGCEIQYNPQATCCGNPLYQGGYRDQAQTLAQKFLTDFAESEHYLVCPSTVCVAMIRHAYEELVTEEYQQAYYGLQRRMFEFTEFITDILEVEEIEGAKLEGLATYLDTCTALRACGIEQSPRKLLSKVAGLQLVEMKEGESCCGAGVNFGIQFQAISVGMAEKKIDNANATQAQYLVSTDATCLLHLDGYIQKNRKKIQIMHIADVLASGW